MNYSQPRQIDPASDRPDAGKWRYTTMNDGRVWEEGYCSPWVTCPDCEGQSVLGGHECLRCDCKGVILADDPCPGHDTKAGAYEHQTQYVLDKKLRLDGRLVDEQRPCLICREWTQGVAHVEHQSFVLCDVHRTREQVADLFGLVGDSFGTF